MRKYFFLICCAVLLVVFLGCKQEAETTFFKTNLPPDADGIVRDIPEDCKSEHQQYLKQKFDSSLGLQELQNGFHGLEIRIGESGGLSPWGRLFLIRYDGSFWRGELYYFRDSISNAGEEGYASKYEGAIVMEKQVLKLTSREWKQFVNELLELEIDNLRDFTEISGYGASSDEVGVSVEIAQDRFYKIYRMPTPGLRKQTIKEAGQVDRMVELIDRKFGNKLNDPAYGG